MPCLNISFEIWGQKFTYLFRPDTAFISKENDRRINSCEGLEIILEGLGINGVPKNMLAFDGIKRGVMEFDCLITEISGDSGSLKNTDMGVTLSCSGCKRGKIINRRPINGKILIQRPRKILKKYSRVNCQKCLERGVPNVFGFEIMRKWIAEFNSIDERFTVEI